MKTPHERERSARSHRSLIATIIHHSQTIQALTVLTSLAIAFGMIT